MNEWMNKWITHKTIYNALCVHIRKESPEMRTKATKSYKFSQESCFSISPFTKRAWTKSEYSGHLNNHTAYHKSCARRVTRNDYMATVELAHRKTHLFRWKYDLSAIHRLLDDGYSHKHKGLPLVVPSPRVDFRWVNTRLTVQQSETSVHTAVDRPFTAFTTLSSTIQQRNDINSACSSYNTLPLAVSNQFEKGLTTCSPVISARYPKYLTCWYVGKRTNCVSSSDRTKAEGKKKTRASDRVAPTIGHTDTILKMSRLVVRSVVPTFRRTGVPSKRRKRQRNIPEEFNLPQHRCQNLTYRPTYSLTNFKTPVILEQLLRQFPCVS